MNINRNNYEVYMIDYFDGKLDPVQTAELMYFLSQNPDLENEFIAYENVPVPTAELKLIDKDDLKKNFSDITNVTDDNFEEFCIAEVEGDLDEQSHARLFQYLDINPHKKRELELYQKTKLKPDESVLFPGLYRLKKHRLTPYGITKKIYYTGIAAAVLLMVLLTFIFRRIQEPDLITSTKTVPEDAMHAEESVSTSTSVKETALDELRSPRDSNRESLQDNNLVSILNDDIRTASPDETAEIIHALKPIAISKIDHISNPSGMALLTKDHPLQHPVATPPQPEKSLAEFIREKLLAPDIARSTENLDIWAFAQVSLKGINYLTESDVQISRKLGSDGKMSEFSIDSESFSFSTPLKK